MDQLNKVHENIKEFIIKLNENSISKKRLKILDKIINELNKNTLKNNYPKIIFICTHNSRRSQLAEIWSHTFSFIFKKQNKIFSAGTSKEEFNIRAVNVLKKVGFVVGVANNCIFYHPQKIIQCMVHGDALLDQQAASNGLKAHQVQNSTSKQIGPDGR